MATHGLVSTYNYGCRCDACRRASAEHKHAMRRRSAARIAADPSLAPHGRHTTYTNWGCRCEPCRTANTARCRASREARQARAVRPS